MKHTSGAMGFWEPGGRMYVSELANEAAEQLAKLTERRDAAPTLAERAQIDQQIADARAEFQQKCKDAQHSLF